MSEAINRKPRLMSDDERIAAAERARFEKDKEIDAHIDGHAASLIHLLAKRYPKLVKSVAEKIRT